MLSLLDYQIIGTLAYSAQFKFPLTKDEIFNRLLSSDQALLVKRNYMVDLEVAETSKKVPPLIKKDLEFGLKKLKRIGVVEELGGSFYLSACLKNNEELQNLIQQKKHKKRKSKKLKKQAWRLKTFFRKQPQILAAGFTGALAVDNPELEPDLDLIMIVQKNRLWLTRSVVLLRALILGKKRPFWEKNKKDKDQWCFNLWLEEGAMCLPNHQRNTYSAYEAAQINWFYDPYNFRAKFYQQNQWLEKYLAHFPLKRANDAPDAVVDNEFMEKSNKGGLLDYCAALLNKLIFFTWKLYLCHRNKIPLINLSLSQAFLHDDASYKQLLDEWHKQLNLVFVKLK
jgi:hypothetical protein